jgi:ATP-dependent Clp protease ATP-binding subunit ClpA
VLFRSIEKGFDPKMGARPLQRVIDKEIKRDLAKMMLFGDLKNGGWATITVDNDKLVIVAKSKIPKIPLLTVDSSETENVV